MRVFFQREDGARDHRGAGAGVDLQRAPHSEEGVAEDRARRRDLEDRERPAVGHHGLAFIDLVTAAPGVGAKDGERALAPELAIGLGERRFGAIHGHTFGHVQHR